MKFRSRHRSTTAQGSQATARWLNALAPLALATLSGLPTPSHAVDGCLALLCFAAPSWSAIQQCVPPVQQVLSDLARGKPFPTCNMAGAGNNANHQWSSVPANCPPQYVGFVESDSGAIPSFCAYDGVISVTINGALWLNTWWSLGGGTVTDYSPAAKAQFGTWSTKFEDDYAVWAASHPASVACTGAC